ncbi:uncharacterized protein N7484_005248 [Penicillium longicatenatum]|uniref:uncharacterized protein n=1 Tax=Penicillium longicatenatum TaxID=1561947 RepID=UPI0025473313|nr:uncharacterized protein N7484_005248 [Penicillium longicatenatum]KAJ5651525.1 hypothetical protein N7484_005248 [Penicillium longicatenatum]
MSLPSHNLDALEQRRLALKENVFQLQKSLYHWRTWEAEYDGLRDEIKLLPDDATTDDLVAVGRDFGGALVTEKEMETIFGTRGAARSSQQIISLLGRRIDYVKQNITTMEKRLCAAEDELTALDVSESAPDMDGTDFPMREIMEELDEDGGVISGSVNTPGDQAPQLLEVLKKVGVDNIPDKAGSDENPSGGASSTPLKREGNANTSATESRPNEYSNRFTPGPEANDSPQLKETDLSEPVSNLTDGDRKQPPVTDIDESLEDAQLRREMFQYGIDEVGAIVAELELDEDGSDVSFDEDYAWATDEDGEEEDEFGRSRTELSEEYHKQMRELEEKLNARGMWNMGKDSQTFPSEVREEVEAAAAAEAIQPDDVAKSPSKAKKPKKRVAFADDLDIAPAPQAPRIEQIQTTEKRTLPPKSDVVVLSDAIVERTDCVKDTPPPVLAATTPKKASRFKSARSGAPAAGTTPKPVPTSGAQLADSHSIGKQVNAVPSTSLPALFPATPQTPKPFSTPIQDAPGSFSAPQPPQGKTLADTLVEREIAPGTAPAPELDDLDEEIHRREIATEFYKMRNHMIQQRGGFVNNEEPEMVLIEAEESPKRMSKFRAARMNQ